MTPLYERLPVCVFPEHPRHFHAYCVGTPRSGTVSICDQFRNFRSAHEPESRFLTQKIIAYRTGQLSYDGMMKYIRHRDRRMQLEMDSSYLNSEIIEFLVPASPESKFVLTLRDCLSWADSFTNFLINKPEFLNRKRHIREHMALEFGTPPFHYSPYEKILEESGLHPIRQYLTYWTDHNQRVLENVPADRLLVIRTTEIGESAAPLEKFLSLPPGSLISSVHSNPARARHSILEKIDPVFLHETMLECCGELMARFFPDKLNEPAAKASLNSQA